MYSDYLSTPFFIGQWRSRVKIIGGARAPFFPLPTLLLGEPVLLFSFFPPPQPTAYIYIFWSLPNYWGGPGPQGPLMLLRPCRYRYWCPIQSSMEPQYSGSIQFNGRMTVALKKKQRELAHTRPQNRTDKVHHRDSTHFFSGGLGQSRWSTILQRRSTY